MWLILYGKSSRRATLTGEAEARARTPRWIPTWCMGGWAVACPLTPFDQREESTTAEMDCFWQNPQESYLFYFPLLQDHKLYKKKSKGSRSVQGLPCLHTEGLKRVLGLIWQGIILALERLTRSSILLQSPSLSLSFTPSHIPEVHAYEKNHRPQGPTQPPKGCHFSIQ